MLLKVKTNYGYVEGVLSNSGNALFRGVPYAKPPVGDLRWKAPQDLDKWEGVRKCDTYGPACMQFDRWKDATDDVTDDSGHEYIRIANYPYPPKMSEDCLYLNIYSPALTDSDKLPVCFYIHGGGLQQWYGSDYEYCGDQFCKEGCIVVTITYRLNVFGYFACKELEEENEYQASGNYGLLDQIKALKWVYENIEYFGGDKERIMVFGQSAGGASALALLLSPLSEKYLNRVSLQSCGGLTSMMKDASKEEIYEKGRRFMEACGCKTVAELRKLSAETLRDKNDTVFHFFDAFMHCVDGYSITENSETKLREGRFKDVDMIIGCTRDEGACNKDPAFGFEMCSSIVALAKKQLINKHKPVYSYVFCREQPGDDVGVPHSSDNRYQFGSLDGSWRPYAKEDYELSLKMTKYWANFAKTGNPNSEDSEKWEPYTKECPKQMRLDINTCEMHDFNIDTDGRVEKLSNQIINN